MHRLIRFFAALSAVAVGVIVMSLVRFDREAWLADYAALKAHMGVAYANLDWMRERRGVDTRALDRRTEAALRSARTDHAAVGWGPYLWDSSWPRELFANDGYHPSALGSAQIAALLRGFLNQSPYTPWWNRPAGAGHRVADP